ncbi:NAD-dependent epimerase/dehydratase family protein [candidate division WOR-3 bacterium]|nr:NAD-dependent epimerase/dehydratase family protein [candidate division WOR-3 bacterium]
MKLLILGGTRFVGLNLVDSALTRGYEITLFNRGKTNKGLFPEVEHLYGDRDSDLKPLQGRKWDVVVDTCGYVPRIVRKSAELLAGSVGHYTFISSINAYADFTKPGIDENSPLATIDDETVEEVTEETYGPLKVLCEKAAEQAMPGRILVLRCGLIVGPHDQSDRFTYWPVRVNSGGEILALSPRQQQIQFIDVRDLVEFILLMADKRQTGIFNTTGPGYTMTTQQFLEECKKNTESEAKFTWVDEEFIAENEINIPLWLPRDWAGICQVNCQKAVDAGLTFRPLSCTIRDTLSWHATRGVDYELKTGLKPEREREFLKAWHDTFRGN